MTALHLINALVSGAVCGIFLSIFLDGPESWRSAVLPWPRASIFLQSFVFVFGLVALANLLAFCLAVYP